MTPNQRIYGYTSMLISYFDKSYHDLIYQSNLAYTYLFRLGTYGDDEVRAVDLGGVILGHCDGGYNEYFLLYEKLPDELKRSKLEERKYIIIDINLCTTYSFDSIKELNDYREG